MSTPIITVVSGGQSGADLGGLRAAKRCGIPTGGYMPRGWMTEFGPRPNYKEWFGMDEWITSDYKDRTRENVRLGDGTVIFGQRSPGSNATEEFCRVLGKPCIWITSKNVLFGVDPDAMREFSEWIGTHSIQVLNVSGNRESITLGIEFGVEDFLVEALS